MFRLSNGFDSTSEAKSRNDKTQNVLAEWTLGIEEVEQILKNAEVVDESEFEQGKISIGCTVKLFDFDFDEEDEYRIVGSTEADILNNKISNESPMGLALIGAGVGDVVEVEGPEGNCRFEILEIRR